MSKITGKKVFMQVEQLETRKPVSEFTMQGIGANINFLLDSYIPFYKFTINGLYRAAIGHTGIDGPMILHFDGEIVNAVIYNNELGTSGSTIIDCELSQDNGATWTSIFSTLPAIDYTATTYAYCGVGETVTGCTAPVLTSPTVPFSKNNALRITLVDGQLQMPKTCGLIVYFQPRNP